MKRQQIMGCAGVFGLAAVLALPGTALAAKNSPDDNAYQLVEAPALEYQKELSPDFAYSEEKWASLRDNVMEYDELADLIHEYNPTVRANRFTYNDQKDNQDLTDVYDALMDDAYDLWDDADDTDTDTYSGRMSAAQYEYAGNTLAKTADQNYVDVQMYKIQYDQTEANLVYEAQQLMVSLEEADITMAGLEESRTLAEASLAQTQALYAVGMATEVDVLSARKSLQDIDTSILSAQKSTNNVHRNLCLMLGWAADAEPEIGPVPETSLEEIEALDPSLDLSAALENNYDLKYYARQKANVSTNELRDSAQANIDDTTNAVTNSVKTQYNTVLEALEEVESAQAALDLEEENLNTLTAQTAAGTATALELLSQQTTYNLAQNDVSTAKLELLLAMEKYGWIIKGLTL